MNIAETAFRVGIQLRKYEKGLHLIELYDKVKSKTSNEAWNLFTRYFRISGIINYFSIPYAYNFIKRNKDNEKVTKYFKKEIDEILSIEEFKELCSLSEFFGNALDKLILDIISPTVPNSFAGIVAKPKLKRAIQDLHVAIQRTGFLPSAAKIYQKRYKVLSIFDQQRKKFPFTKENRDFIYELSKNEEEKEALFYNESMNSLIEFIKELIFEAHLGIFESIEYKLIKKEITKTFNKLILFKYHFVDNYFNNTEGCLIQINNRNKYSYGLVLNKYSQFNSDRFKTKYRGILYPEKDTNIFINHN